jgi:hypothetical protein
LENIEEKDKFLDTYDHQKVKQEDLKHINRSTTCNEIEEEIVFPKRKFQDLVDSQLNSSRPTKKNYFQHLLIF